MYNFFLFLLGICTIPKILWQVCVKSKPHIYLYQKLGLSLPDIKPSPLVIWIHAVSMGETRSIIPLYHKMRTSHPEATFIISSTTETGHHEAKRSLKGAAAYFFLPFDLFIKKAVKTYQPHLLILVEGDYWANLINETKKQGHIVVVSGKISERSAKRFHYCPPLARHFFSNIDLFCVQNEAVAERFKTLGVPSNRIAITGNLKLDLTIPPASKELQQLVPQNSRVLVVGSTHEGEEKIILSALQQLKQNIPDLKLTTFLVPRHPERFQAVAELLKKEKIPYLLYSKKEQQKGDEQVILMDTMGQLLSCFCLADLAIVGGSFVPDIGGHNIYEPVACGVPVFFGPYLYAQPDLKKRVLEGEAGKEIAAKDLGKQLTNYFQDNQEAVNLRLNAQKVADSGHAVTEKTEKAIFRFLLNHK